MLLRDALSELIIAFEILSLKRCRPMIFSSSVCRVISR